MNDNRMEPSNVVPLRRPTVARAVYSEAEQLLTVWEVDDGGCERVAFEAHVRLVWIP